MELEYKVRLKIIQPESVCVSEIDLYADYNQDKSYTPHEISIRSGSCFNVLNEQASVCYLLFICVMCNCWGNKSIKLA